jgi:hypothetical protein
MKKFTLTIAVLSSMIAGCAWTPPSKNPNIAPNPEKQAFQACMKKNGGDKSKCTAERQKYLDRQEMDIMDNNG